MNKKIEIVSYNPEWPKQFELLKAVYTQLLGTLLLSLEHVGSTSVPGLAAKPVLDIDLVIVDAHQLQPIIPVLETAGYAFRGDQGIKDRYAFSAKSRLAPDTGSGQLWPAHHLYCCVANSTSLSNHILLRDALRRDAILREDYSILKKKLAIAAQGDIDKYVEGKSDFISNILRHEGLSANDVNNIIQQNRKK